MRLGLNLGYPGSDVRVDMDLVAEAERLGYDVVWAAEAWGADAVTVLSWIAARTERIHVGSAILQIPARTPAMTAMTATTLNELSGGRFRLGLGMSGPQVVEGWHGVPYGRPIARTREAIDIIRMIVARNHPARHHGDHYQLPYRGPEATGLGKPLTLISHPTHELPIYLAAIGPRNVRLAAELADGWLPTLYSPTHAPAVFGPLLDEGFAAAGDPTKRNRFDIAPTAHAIVTDDAAAAHNRLRPQLAFYIGGMGSRDRNFYNDLVVRYGFREAAGRIQDEFLSGDPAAAAAAVPDELIAAVALIGAAAEIRDRLAAWREAGVTTLNVTVDDVDTLRALPDLIT